MDSMKGIRRVQSETAYLSCFLSLLPDLFYCIQNNLPYFSYLLSILFCDAQFPKKPPQNPPDLSVFAPVFEASVVFAFTHLLLIIPDNFFQKQFFSLLFSAVYINKVRKSRQKTDISITTSKCYNKKEGKINVKKGTTMTKTVQKSKARDMTQGSIWKQLLLFSLPLMAGNLFQQLYNTVDSIVVGNFVGKEALAAVGSVGPIINSLIGFFHGTFHRCRCHYLSVLWRKGG